MIKRLIGRKFGMYCGRPTADGAPYHTACVLKRSSSLGLWSPAPTCLRSESPR